MRLFVAIDLPETVKAELALLSGGLPGARWISREQLHLTLRFIGEVDGGQIQAIREALEQINLPPFTIRLEDVGFFPPRGRPRVIWSGVVIKQPLLQLHQKIESQLVRTGIEPEERKFAPHITLARLKNTPTSKVGRFLQQHSLFVGSEFTVAHFALYSSVLGRKGAKHYMEEEYPLQRSSPAGIP